MNNEEYLAELRMQLHDERVENEFLRKRIGQLEKELESALYQQPFTATIAYIDGVKFRQVFTDINEVKALIAKLEEDNNVCEVTIRAKNNELLYSKVG